MRPRIKVFGERNTGTNVIIRMLSVHLRVKSLRGDPPWWWEKRLGTSDLSTRVYFSLTGWSNHGWKHAAPGQRLQKSRCVFIALFKNPYAWLLSLHKRPYHNWEARNLSFPDFLNSPWPLTVFEGLPRGRYLPVHLWNEKNRAYLKLTEASDRGLAITYEDVLRNPHEFVRKVADLAGVTCPGDVRLPDSGVKSADRGVTVRDYRRHYLGEQWRTELTANDVENINKEIDLELVKTLGYSLIDPRTLSGSQSQS